MRTFATLARWLGPWADPSRLPEVACRDDDLDGLRVRIYSPPRGPKRTFVIAPGIHYAGADDPRFDRFCRILAAAGHLVIAPFIPDFLAMVPTARAIDDFRRVLDAVPRWSSQRPVVFSISFGSLLAFAMAAERGDAIERLVVFGGYADFHEVMRFSLTGEVASGRRATRDPLNQSIVLLNLIDLIDHDRREQAALIAGWRRYVARVWGRAEMKVDQRFVAVADELAPSVPASVRELFRIGTGAAPGAWALARPALERFDATALDPTPYLANIRGRVELVHGTDDDVIPFEHAHALAAALTAADVRVHITGLYGHTGVAASRLAAMPRELATMLRVLRVLSG